MSYRFEALSDRHRADVIAIFNHYIANSFAAYPESPVGYDVFDRFLAVAQGYPAVVIKDDPDRVVGFAFLHPYRLDSTFRHTAEITYFILPEHTGQGLGTRILERFVQQARQQGIDTILANISSRNPKSLRFHRKNGFRECGRFCRVGRKFGEDFDVVWMQLEL